MIKKIIVTTFAALLFWSLTSFAFGTAIQLDENLKPDALPTFDAVDATDENNSETSATQTTILYVGSIVSRFLLFAGALAVIFLILAGANYILAFGKDEKIENSKRALFWVIFGLIIIMLSYAIVRGAIQIALQIDVTAE